jgi:hypothetical protein
MERGRSGVTGSWAARVQCGFLYENQLKPVAELYGDGSLKARFVHQAERTPDSCNIICSSGRLMLSGRMPRKIIKHNSAQGLHNLSS